VKTAVLDSHMTPPARTTRALVTNRRFRTALWLMTFAGAFTVSHLPPPKDRIPPPIHDKTLHVIGCFVLGMVTMWRLARPQNTILVKTAFLWLLVIVAYGAVDELTQPWTGRTCEFGDWVADAVGAALGIACYLIWDRLRSRNTLTALDRVTPS
jgi:VanZ family protein